MTGMPCTNLAVRPGAKSLVTGSSRTVHSTQCENEFHTVMAWLPDSAANHMCYAMASFCAMHNLHFGYCRTSFQGSGEPKRQPQLHTNGTADIAY